MQAQVEATCAAYIVFEFMYLPSMLPKPLGHPHIPDKTKIMNN